MASRNRKKWVVVCLLATCLIVSTAEGARAQVPAVPAFEESGLRPATPILSQFPFESINLINRNVLLRFVDLELPGNGGFNLTFVRTINSRDGEWHFGIEQAPLEMRAVAGGSECLGNQWAFFWVDGSAEYSNCDSGPDLLDTSRRGTFTKSEAKLRMPNGLVATYDMYLPFWGRLQSLEDPFGNRVDFSWTPVSYGTETRTELTAVTQYLGADTRTVTFTRANAQWFGGEMWMSFAGRTWRYLYQVDDGYPPPGGGSTYHLVEAKPPFGSSWSYEYQPVSRPGYSGQIIFPIRQIRTPNGGTIAYTFEEKLSNGAEGGSTYNAVQSRTVNDGTQAASWTFDSDQFSSPPHTLVFGPDGTQTTYFFEVRQVGNYFRKVVLPTRRDVVKAGSLLESETYGHQVQQNTIFFTPVVSHRDLTRNGRHYVTDLSYTNSFGYEYPFPTSIQESGELSRHTAIEYASFIPYIVGRISSRTVTSDGQTMVESRTYNTADGFLRSQAALGVSVTYQEGDHGNPASMADPRGKTTGFSYKWGVVKDTATPEYTIARDINIDGTVAVESRGSTTTSYTYDDLGRITHVSTNTAGRAEAVTEYDEDGHWVSTTQGANGTTTYVDGFGRAVLTVDAAGTQTRTGYDIMGRVSYRSYPFGNGHAESGEAMQYDGIGRVLNVSRPDGTVSYGYGAGTVSITESGSGAPAHTTVQTYAAFSDPDKGRLVTFTDPSGASWAYSYDGLGHLTRVDAPQGPARTWNYAGGPYLHSTYQPESGTTSFVTDEAGNVRQSTDAAGRVINFTYDDNGRLVGRDAPGSDDDVTLAYDAWDNQVALQNGLVHTTFEYDTANRLRLRRDVISQVTLDQTYNYDSSDNMTEWYYPSGRLVRYDYGYQHRVTAVFTSRPGQAERVLASNVEYQPTGALKRFDYGNGQHFISNVLDGRGRPTDWTTGPLNLGYAYDHLGNVRTIADGRPGMSHTYDYDALDRLTSVDGAQLYQYDVLGNRTRAGGTNFVYDAGTSRLVSMNGWDNGSFGHDNVGNMTSQPGVTFSYSPVNLLTSAVVSGQTSTYGYDGAGLRVLRTTSSGSTYYVRGGGGSLAAEYIGSSGSLSLTREYMYLGGTLLASMGPNLSVPVSVGLTSPVAGARFALGAPITLTASPGAGVGAIDRVEFYLNGALLGTDTTAPYSITRSDLPAGPNQRLQARLVTATGVPAVSAVVSVTIGTAVAGDFNGDGSPDLLFQDANGGLKVWLMQGTVRLAEVALTPSAVNAAWRVVGVDDFNGDWKPDIVFQHATTGQVYVWFMDGTTLTSGGYLTQQAPLPWQVSAVGDLDGDGQPDVVWTNATTGERYVWLQNGLATRAEGYLSIPAVGTDWTLVSVVDLNQDGRADLVWQRTDGSIAYWMMNGLTALATGYFSPSAVNPAWQLRASANIDGVGGPELIYQHTSTHQLYVWFLSGTSLAAGSYLTPDAVTGTWQIVGGK